MKPTQPLARGQVVSLTTMVSLVLIRVISCVRVFPVSFQLLALTMVATKPNTTSLQSHSAMFPTTSPTIQLSQELCLIILGTTFNFEIYRQNKAVVTFYVSYASFSDRLGLAGVKVL